MALRRGRPRWLWAAWSVAALALLLISWDGAWLPGRILTGRDSSELYIPMKAFLQAALARGHIPRWYPYDGIGLSVLGSLVFGLLDPFNVLLLFLTPAMAVKWEVLLSTVVGGLGVLAIARIHRLRWSAAWFAAMAFACSGLVLSQTNSLLYLGAYSRIPLAIACAEGLARRPCSGWAAGLALALASILWVGDPEALLFAAGAASIVALINARDRRRVLAWLAVAAGLTTLLVLPLLGPAMVTFGSSPRAAALGESEALSWSLHPTRLLELALGSPFGLNQGLGHIADSFGGQNETFFSPSVFMGFGVVVLALAALAERTRRRTVAVYAVVTVLGLWLTCGEFGHLYAHVPLLTRFRYPEKLMVWPTLGLAVLAGIGFDALVRKAVARQRAVVIGLALAVVGALAGVVFPAFLPGLAGAAVLVSALAAGARLPRSARAGVLAIPLVLEPAWRNRSLVLQTTADRISPSASPAELPAGVRVCSDLSIDDYGARPPGHGWDTVWEGARQVLAPGLGAIYGFRGVDELVPAEPAGISYLCSVLEQCEDVCAQVTGAAYGFLTERDAPAFLREHGGSRVPHAGGEEAALVKYAWQSEHAEVRPALAVTGDERQVAAEIHRGQLGVGEHVLVPAGDMPDPSALAATGRVVSEDDRADEIHLRVEALGPTMLRVHEAYTREWKATVDGAAAEVWKVDLGLIGVPLRAAGVHEVQLSYRPLGWPWTLMGWALGLVLCGALLWRRRQPRAARPAARRAPAPP